jgi:hypothetical protein
MEIARRSDHTLLEAGRALSLNADDDGALHADGSRIIAAGVGQAIAAQFAEESPGSAEQGAR